MEATLTLTRTSVRPNPGTFTSRTSAPGAGWAFTTACIVFGIPHAPAKQPILAPQKKLRSQQPEAERPTKNLPPSTPITPRKKLLKSFLDAFGVLGGEKVLFRRVRPRSKPFLTQELCLQSR